MAKLIDAKYEADTGAIVTNQADAQKIVKLLVKMGFWFQHKVTREYGPEVGNHVFAFSPGVIEDIRKKLPTVSFKEI